MTHGIGGIIGGSERAHTSKRHGRFPSQPRRWADGRQRGTRTHARANSAFIARSTCVLKLASSRALVPVHKGQPRQAARPASSGRQGQRLKRALRVLCIGDSVVDLSTPSSPCIAHTSRVRLTPLVSPQVASAPSGVSDKQGSNAGHDDNTSAQVRPASVRRDGRRVAFAVVPYVRVCSPHHQQPLLLSGSDIDDRHHEQP